MRFPFDNVDGDDMERSAPQTESSWERGFGAAEIEDLGRSDAPGHDGWDIADEGPGHRG